MMIAMIENSRMPVDDPKTHLELTMIHEVMILDNSGFDLGLILYCRIPEICNVWAIIVNFFIGGLSLVMGPSIVPADPDIICSNGRIDRIIYGKIQDES